MPEEVADKEFNIDKEKHFSEWYNELLWRAELIDQRYNVKGFLVHRPNATIAENLIEEMFEKELQRRGHKPMRFPAVIPEENFEKEAEHVEGFSPNVFWITHGGSTKLEKKLALRPTSETAMYIMYAQWIRSYRDLPFKAYQRCQVWRYETKHTRPLLRDREFYWIEAHDVFESKREAERQVIEDMEITEEIIHNKLGIPFLYFRRPSWDKFAGAEYTFGADALIASGRVLQLPSTHFLGQNFSKTFGISFIDKDGNERHPWQTCYGPAVGRILAAVIAVHGDNKGCVFPFEIAPIQIVIVPIFKTGVDIDAINTKCLMLHEKLKKEYRVEFDESDKQPGAKFYYWELRGVPIRIEVGEKELHEAKLTIVRRDTGKREMIDEKELDKYLKNVGKEILKNLKEKADKDFNSRLFEAKTKEELKKLADKGGFIKVPFCSIDSDGKPCADVIKEETGLEVRGVLHGREEAAKGKCIICGREAKLMVYLAKSY
ncbi:proline--tRNA ligase [Candidatus Micrarchaeota archaeon]|nr:MAG: proline--tRNA ligase [Candidatus Micrarchaeota archaeon]